MQRFYFKLLHKQYGRVAILSGLLLRGLAGILDSCSPGRQPRWREKRREDGVQKSQCLESSVNLKFSRLNQRGDKTTTKPYGSQPSGCQSAPSAVPRRSGSSQRHPGNLKDFPTQWPLLHQPPNVPHAKVTEG